MNGLQKNIEASSVSNDFLFGCLFFCPWFILFYDYHYNKCIFLCIYIFFHCSISTNFVVPAPSL